MAEEGRIDPIIGRDKEIERVSQILSRRKIQLLEKQVLVSLQSQKDLHQDSKEKLVEFLIKELFF
jgi:ATP-dependent Clp protease ATP-binding subunit ClpA